MAYQPTTRDIQTEKRSLAPEASTIGAANAKLGECNVALAQAVNALRSTIDSLVARVRGESSAGPVEAGRFDKMREELTRASLFEQLGCFQAGVNELGEAIGQLQALI